MSRGVVLVSHTKEIPEGLKRLIGEVAKDVPITTAGGLEDGGIGTSMERISQAIEENTADELLAFYDLGSAKMNLEMAIEMTDKKVTFLFPVQTKMNVPAATVRADEYHCTIAVNLPALRKGEPLPGDYYLHPEYHHCHRKLSAYKAGKNSNV